MYLHGNSVRAVDSKQVPEGVIFYLFFIIRKMDPF